MIAAFRRHGWKYDLTFGQYGPILIIYGDFPGNIMMPVPVRLDDDHSTAMECIYSLYAMYAQLRGVTGTA